MVFYLHGILSPSWSEGRMGETRPVLLRIPCALKCGRHINWGTGYKRQWPSIRYAKHILKRAAMSIQHLIVTLNRSSTSSVFSRAVFWCRLEHLVSMAFGRWTQRICSDNRSRKSNNSTNKRRDSGHNNRNPPAFLALM